MRLFVLESVVTPFSKISKQRLSNNRAFSSSYSNVFLSVVKRLVKHLTLFHLLPINAVTIRLRKSFHNSDQFFLLTIAMALHNINSN